MAFKNMRPYRAAIALALMASGGISLTDDLAPRRRRNHGSKYMPHIGNKERARHAGKPDGPMHGLPPLHRS